MVAAMQLCPALLCQLGILICLVLASGSHCCANAAKAQVVERQSLGDHLKQKSAWSWLSDILSKPLVTRKGNNWRSGPVNHVRSSRQEAVIQESLRWEIKSNWCEATSFRLMKQGGKEDQGPMLSSFLEPAELDAKGDPLRIMEQLEGQSSSRLNILFEAESQIPERRSLREEDDVSADELEGDFYLNLEIFKRTYEDMENKMQVFVYREGKLPLAHYYDTTDHYAIDGIFQRFLDNKVTPLVTDDADSANLFFVPMNFAGVAKFLVDKNRPLNLNGRPNLKPQKAYVGAFVDLLEQRYPYLNANGGRDHFVLSCHEWAPLMSRGHRTLHVRMMRALCNNNVSSDFAWTRDVAIPEINMPRQEPITTYGGPPVSQRSVLAFFAGKAEGKVRTRLIEVWQNRRHGMRIFEGDIPSTDPLTFKDYLQQSKFCLCPGGMQVNTARIMEAVYNDCVPVILSDGLVLPFSDVLDWAKFAVIIYYKQIPKLRDILSDVVQDGKYIKMHSRLALVRKHLIINETPRKYDAFHMILHSFWLRQLQMREEAGPIFKDL